MKSWRLGVVGIAACAVVIFYLEWRLQTVQPERVTTSQRPAVVQGVAFEKQKPSKKEKLERALAMSPRSEVPSLTEPSDTGTRGGVALPSPSASPEEIKKRFFQDLDDRVETELVDPGWRFETENAMQAAFARAQALQGVSADIECASANCRVRLSHPESEELPQDAILELVRQAPYTSMELHFSYAKGETTIYTRDQGRMAELGEPPAPD